MTTAALTMTCRCGRSSSEPCPTVTDILKAQAKFIGWTFDERGHVVCPECAAGAPPPAKAAPPPHQAELFGA